jgi:uncharacterized membrane protein YqhA
MEKILRVAIVVVVVITFINALVFFGLGVFYSIQTYWNLLWGTAGEHRPGLAIVESMDRFFIGFIFIIFSVGLSKLFLPGSTIFQKLDLPWLAVADFHQLKLLLWSTILTAVLVEWLVATAAKAAYFDWPDLVLPIGIFILAVAGKFVKDIQ